MSKISFSTTSFKSEDLKEVLNVYRLLNWFDLDVNLSHFLESPIIAKELSQHILEEGFQINFASGGWCDFFKANLENDETFQSVEKQVEILGLLKTNNIRLFLGRLEAEHFDEKSLENVVSNVQHIASKFPDINFSFENHDGASLVPVNVSKIIHAIDLDNVGTTLDPINYLKAGADPLEAIRLCKNKIFHVHAKGLDAENQYCEYDKSIFDYKNFWETLKSTGYTGGVTLEYEGENNPIVKLLSSYKKLEEDLK